MSCDDIVTDAVVDADAVVDGDVDAASVAYTVTAMDTNVDLSDKYSTDEIHDEVECMLAGTNQEIIELIATDPKHYLNIVQHYKKMRDGRDIYLPDLFNIIVNRSTDQMTIKFKMSDDTQWYDVGFNGGVYSADEVYEAFSKKVEHLIKNPQLSHRDIINDTMKPTAVDKYVDTYDRQAAQVANSKPLVSQGNQYKLSKIDRFLGRTAPEARYQVPDDDDDDDIYNGPLPSPQTPLVHEEHAEIPPPSRHAPQTHSLEVMPTEIAPPSRHEVPSHTDRLAEYTSSQTHTHNDSLWHNEYNKLLALFSNTSEFVKTLFEHLSVAPRPHRILLTEFMLSLDPKMNLS